MRGRLALTLAALTIVGAAVVGSCQTTDRPLLTDIRWTQPPAAADRATLGAAPTRQIGVAELSAAPVIDGALDDEAWLEAARTDEWMDVSGAAVASVQTQAWVGRRDERLFLALRCVEPNVAGMVAEVTEDGGPAWSDDCIELFFDGNMDRETYRQIIVNSLGVATAVDGREKDWRPTIERGVQVGEGEWTVELAVSIADLGILGSEFGLNLCRERRAGGDTELSCWSPTGRGFGTPSAFGLAKLGASYIKSFDPGAAAVGLNEARVVMLNDSEEHSRLRARLQWWQNDEIAREDFDFFHELAPSARSRSPTPSRARATP